MAMNLSWAVAGLLLLPAICGGQVRKPIDFKPCTQVTDRFKAEVDKFNAAHKDGFQIMLTCTYSGDPHYVKRAEIHVALTGEELSQLHALRADEDAASGAMVEYEKHLFRAHRLRQPSVDEPCYYFAGIKIDDDYITIDPNPMMAGPDCEGPIAWRLK